jgi:hypothetical protein
VLRLLTIRIATHGLQVHVRQLAAQRTPGAGR